MTGTDIGLFPFLRENWGYLSTLCAGGGSWLAARNMERKKYQRDQDSRIVRLTEALHAVDKDLAQLKFLLSAATGLDVEHITLERIKALVSDNIRLLDDLTAFIQSAPALVWMKRRAGPGDYVMVQVSEVYAELYLGRAAKFYAGKSDKEIWPEDIAAAFASNDESAFRSRDTVKITEPVHSPLTGAAGRFEGHKWAFSRDGRHYVCGIGQHVDGKANSA